MEVGDKILVKKGPHKGKTMFIYQKEGDWLLVRASKKSRYLKTMHVRQVEVVEDD